MGLGEWSALGTAGLWAISSLFYARVRLDAWTLNLAKNLVAIPILLVHLFVLSRYYERPLIDAPPWAWGLLSLSGLIGILIGDTFFFRSLQVLGPRRALMLATTTPIFAAVIGWLFLAESISLRCGLGIIVTLCGVAIVIRDQRASIEAPGLFPGTLAAGTLYGIFGAVCQAIGAAIAKRGMDACDTVAASFIRILAPCVIAVAILLLRRQLRTAMQKICQRKNLQGVVPGAVLGTWLGIWLSQVAIKHAPVAVATTLMTTCPIFAIPLVRIYFKHPIRGLAVAGTVIAIIGVYFVATY